MGSEHVPLPPELADGEGEGEEVPPPPPLAEEEVKQAKKAKKAKNAKKAGATVVERNEKKRKKRQREQEKSLADEKETEEHETEEETEEERGREEEEEKTPVISSATVDEDTVGGSGEEEEVGRKPQPSGPVVVVTAEGDVMADPAPPYPCIDPMTLERWGTVDGDAAPDPLLHPSDPPADGAAFFPIRADLNRILLLWEGNPLHLGVDALVNSSNETLSNRTGDARELYSLAGPEFLQDVKLLDGCRTGEAKVTDAHELPNQKIVVHTVGPKFNKKYETAAENALHSCYRSCLAHVVERKLRSLALVTINSPKRGYPRPEACHVALRTIRRFLEKYGEHLDHVVLVMASLEDWNIYRRLLPVYFPRNAEDLASQKEKLPPGIQNTNEFGEKIIKEREIRINTSLFGSSIADKEPSSPAPTESNGEEVERRRKKGKKILQDDDHDNLRAFMTLQKHSPDTVLPAKTNAKKQKKDIMDEEQTKRIFQTFLSKAKTEDLSDVARKNAVFHSGVDSLGQPVIVFLGCNFPKAKDVTAMRRFLTYIIRTLDAVAQEKFTAVFLLSETSKPQRPELGWLQLLYRMWELNYTESMVNMLVVHPAPWVRFTMTVLKQFTSPRFKKKLKFLDSLADLFEYIPQDVLKIPNRVYRFDQRAHGGKHISDDNDANEGL